MNDHPPEPPVTEWLGRLKAGDPDAAEPLLKGYFVRLVALVRQRLPAAARVVADEEDVALSAFNSFFAGAPAGRFPRLDDRDDLWQVLFVLATRKAVDQARRAGRQKRGGGRVVHASAVAGATDGTGPFADVCGREPTPEEAAHVVDECNRLLNMLGEDSLREVARLKMEGHTNAEIAVKIGRVEGTVERKLTEIRKLWQAEVRP